MQIDAEWVEQACIVVLSGFRFIRKLNAFFLGEVGIDT